MSSKGISGRGASYPPTPMVGSLCKGHPMGATGAGQISEIVKQLRGEAGPRQIPGKPKVGLTNSSGAGMMNLHLFKR